MKKILFLMFIFIIISCKSVIDKKSLIDELIKKPELIKTIINDSNTTTRNFVKYYGRSEYNFLLNEFINTVNANFQDGYRIIEEKKDNVINSQKIKFERYAVKIIGKNNSLLIFYFYKIGGHWLLNSFAFGEPEFDGIKE